MTDTDEAMRRLVETLQALAVAMASLGEAARPQPKDRPLSLDEVAEILGITRRSVNGLMASGAIKCRSLLGGKTVVLLSDFNAYLKDLKVRHPRQVRRARAARTLNTDLPEA